MGSHVEERMKAALYTRVSTEEQTKGYSLRQQREALREYCDKNNYEVADEFEDHSSGASLPRPGLDRLRDLVAAGGIDLVLVQDRDRLAREPAYIYILKEEFSQQGTKLRALNDKGDDSPEGQLTEGILDQLAKFERAKTAERGRRGRMRKAREGLVPGSGPAPYGFRYDHDERTYVIDEEKMVWVRKIFAMIADGHSISETTRYLRQRAAPTPGGKLWHRSTVRDIVLNDTYAGTYYWGKEKRTYTTVAENVDGVRRYKQRVRKEIRPEAEWIAVSVPDSGVHNETIERARRRIEGNTWTPSSNGGLIWELSGGVAVCGECGYRLKTHATSNSAKKKYYYYICPDRKTNGENGTCSNTKHFRKEDLEQRVGETLADTLHWWTWVDFVNSTFDRKVRDLKDTHRGSPGEKRMRLYEQREALEGQRFRVEEAYFDLKISKDRWENKLAELDEAIATIDGELAALEDIDASIRETEERRRSLLRFERAALLGVGPSPDGIPEVDNDGHVDTYSIFTDRGGEPTRAVPDGGERRRAERRLDIYRKLGLRVGVAAEDEIVLEISGIPVGQNAGPKGSTRSPTGTP